MKVSEIQAGQTIPRGKPRPAPVVEKLPIEKNPKLWKAVQGFESLFMAHLVNSMQKTLPEGAVSGGGMAGMMFTQVMSEAMAEGGGIGLADLLYRNLQHQVPAAGAGDGEGEGGGEEISLKKLLLPDIRKVNYEK